MKLFSEIQGTYNQKYDDDLIGLRFPCNNKRSGEQPEGILADVLEHFGLSAEVTSWEFKRKIWEFLKIDVEPINLQPNERSTILEKNINNAAEVKILRNKEGQLLISNLNLSQTIKKSELENVLIKKILNQDMNEKNESEGIPMAEDEVKEKINYDKQYDKYVNDGNIEFITFHPSYSYEDFVEGIRPILKEGQNVQFEIHNGIFKDICLRAIQALVKELIKQNQDSGLSELGNWSDFNSSLDLIKETLKKTPASTLPSSINHVLIIDEINRGDISKIFGELITLIESDKRLGEKNMISVKLPYTKEKFCVPPNLYIIGTMNTADRSIALVDVALRRRFDFQEMKPQLENLKNDPKSFGSEEVKSNDLFKDSIDAVIKLNNILGLNEDIGKDKKIGHAFFCNINSPDQIMSAWKNKIMPLLEEYYFFDKSDLQRLSNQIYTTKDGWAFDRAEEFIEHVNRMPEE
jgi:5-methylcytosine-specific restriction protein B